MQGCVLGDVIVRWVLVFYVMFVSVGFVLWVKLVFL